MLYICNKLKTKMKDKKNNRKLNKLEVLILEKYLQNSESNKKTFSRKQKVSRSLIKSSVILVLVILFGIYKSMSEL